MNARIRVRVGIRETLPVAALGERGEGQATVSASRGTDVETLHVLERQPAETREGVRPPGAVVDRVEHRVAVLAVVHNIQANLGLTLHNAVDLALQDRGEFILAERTLAVRGVRLEQLWGAGQGANMSGANRHRSPFSLLCLQRTFRASRTRGSVRTVTDAMNRSDDKALIRARTYCVFPVIAPSNVHPLTRSDIAGNPPGKRAKTPPPRPGLVHETKPARKRGAHAPRVESLQGKRKAPP